MVEMLIKSFCANWKIEANKLKKVYTNKPQHCQSPQSAKETKKANQCKKKKKNKVNLKVKRIWCLREKTRAIFSLRSFHCLAFAFNQLLTKFVSF